MWLTERRSIIAAATIAIAAVVEFAGLTLAPEREIGPLNDSGLGVVMTRNDVTAARLPSSDRSPMPARVRGRVSEAKPSQR